MLATSPAASVSPQTALTMSDAVVSLLVWLGLKISRKAPDERFNFGYYKVESMTAFVSAIMLIL